jgi:ABC-2 type transport system permease protein
MMYSSITLGNESAKTTNPLWKRPATCDRRNDMATIGVIFILWLRDMKRFVRSPSRIIGSITIPLLMLVGLGAGFGRMPIPGMNSANYLTYLVPGMVGMTILFGGIFSGMSVLWDRQYGFLKEIMVAPVPRTAIVVGRIASGSTTGILQATAVALFATALGFALPSISGFCLALIFMVFISVIFTGIGLIFASRMKDEQGFGLIMNFLVLPFLFLSGAFAPIVNLPAWVRIVSYIDPLTYGIEGIRAGMLGTSTISLPVSFFVCAGFSVVLVLAGAWFFETSEAV